MVRLTVDFRYSEIVYELWALGEMQELVEPAIEQLAQRDEDETLAELRRKGWDDDEAELDLAHQKIRDMADYVLPRFLRGPLLIALWASYESGVGEVAEKLKDAMGEQRSLDGMKGGFLDRAKGYLEDVLGLALDDDHSRLRAPVPGAVMIGPDAARSFAAAV